MANSGIYWIDVTFDYCVLLLYRVAELLGITYEEINVWLFVVGLPLLVFVSLSINVILYLRLQKPLESCEICQKTMIKLNR